MRDKLLSALSKGLMLFDGGMGTQLQTMGLEIGQPPEGWNFLYPDKIAMVHERYCRAGAQILTTNSFGASPYKLQKGGIAESAYKVNKLAAEIARRAAGEDIFVAGSVGPTGALLLMDEISEEEMLNGFGEQVRGLADGGADVIIIETMSDLQEARIALKAVRQACRLPVIVSMTFQPGQRGYRTMMGTDIPTVVQTLEADGADIIGTNCGVGMEAAIEIVAEMRQFTHLPLLAEPNAGLPQLQDGRTVYRESADTMAKRVPELVRAGAQLIGGCCGTTPEHIAAFRQFLK